MSRQTSLEGEGGTLMKLMTPGGMCKSDVASVVARVFCSRQSRAPYMARRARGQPAKRATALHAACCHFTCKLTPGLSPQTV